ncbi:CvpA family protein [Verrucomicrobia bacterium]|nr:CvpA family protein [Verrucomicrobiota bacterium]
MIWLIAILLLAAFAGFGYLRGSIQMGISVLGLFTGLLLAMPLAPLMMPIYTASGVTNLILLSVLPPITAFVVIGLIFMTVGIVVHMKVKKHFRFKTDEASQLMWKRLNQRAGVAFGLVAGVFYTIVLGVGIYSVGYLTFQVSTDTDPGWLKFITDSRVAMDQNGLGKMAASLDPMPDKFYEVSDILGLSHRNPLLENRYRNYPPFLKMSDRADIQEIAGDTDFHNMLVQQASLADIMKHPLGQKVMSNGELFDVLVNQTDLVDLRNFLENGESAVYDDEKILGRWELNGNALINYTKRNTAGIKSRELVALKTLVENYLDGSSLIAYTDNSYKIEAKEAPVVEEEEEAPRPEFNGGGFGGQPSMSPEMSARYGLGGRGSRAGGPQRSAASAPKPKVTPSINIGGEGNWERTAPGRYLLEIGGRKAQANFNKNRLLIKTQGMQLVFSRVY